MDTDVKWFEMPLAVQMSNIGSEVHRAVRWKNKNDDDKATSFCKKAIEFLNIIKRDPKNKYRINEFDEAINELKDYFFSSDCSTDETTLINYYDDFLAMTY